jgi:hypothetical protein
MMEIEKLSDLSNEQIAKYFDMEEMEAFGSVVGIKSQEYMAMILSARDGNVTQGQRLDKFRKSIKIHKIKQRVIYGD